MRADTSRTARSGIDYTHYQRDYIVITFMNTYSLIRALRTSAASLLMLAMVALSFPVAAVAQEEVPPVEPALEIPVETPAEPEPTPEEEVIDEFAPIDGAPVPVADPLFEEELVTEILELQLAPEGNRDGGDKVNICHKTSSEQNPWNAIQVSENGWGGHSGHNKDFLYGGPVKQNGQPTNDGDEWCEENAPEEKGKSSITVCKVLVDANNQVVTGSATEEFSIPWLDTSTSEGNYKADLADTTFATPLSLNTEVLDASEADDAECYTYYGLKEGNYYYGQELYNSSVFEEPKYNDQHVNAVEDLYDLYPYSGELFDGNEDNDGDRNTDSDGHISLGKNDHRTLVVLNKLKAPVQVPSVTVSATKVACEAEANLPNMAGGADITAATAANWVAQSNGKCWLEDGYVFQWAPNGTADPEDNGTVPLGSPWTSFAPTDENGLATAVIPVASANGTVQMREVLQEGDLPFSGVNENSVSAELYCHTDVAGYDNWEWISNLQAGETYHCVAFNVPPPKTEDSCLLYSETDTLVDGNASVVVPVVNSRWTASMNALAKWIWSESPMIFTAGQEVEVFTRTFALAGPATGATLEIAADNGYSVKLDNVALASDMTDGPEGSHNYQQTDTHNIGALAAGNHTLEFTVTNYELAGENFENNPAGLRYTLTVHGSECRVPDEPTPVCVPDEELLSNGGFESPIISTDWNIVPSGTSGLDWLIAWITGDDAAPEDANAEFHSGVNGWVSHSGDQHAELDSDWGGPSSGQSGEAGAVSMSQTVGTEPGKTYTFSFWFSPRPDQGAGENKAEALANGVVIGATAAVAGNNSQTVWEKYSFDFVATTTETTFSLRDAAGNPNNSVGSFVDDASLVCKAPDTKRTATLSAKKIVCPTEDLLPNWGAGNLVGEITEDTAADFLLANPTCSLQNWDFQWATDAAGDPEDNGTTALEAPWATFSAGTPVEVPAGINLRVREVLQSGYIPFTGQNTDQSVSAEMYCSTDVLHYDNWEYVDGTVAGEEYHCVAFNAPIGNNGGNEPTFTFSTTTVTNTNPEGWEFNSDRNTWTMGIGEYVNGPALAPLGLGSARITTVTNDDRTKLRKYLAAGTQISDITTIRYSTYRAEPTGGALTLAFQFDVNFTGTPIDAAKADARLVYEPYHTQQASILDDAWQEWDALNDAAGTGTGAWWLAGPNPSVCPQANPCTWSEVNIAYPDLQISAESLENTIDTQGAMLFKAGGSWAGFDGNVDRLVIAIKNGLNTHTTTYDFEPEEENGGGDPTPTDTPRNRTGNSRGASSGNGIVAGASTSCEPLLTQYLHIGWNNDSGEVTKLQTFLNSHLGLTLPVTGFFGPMTFSAVEAFQTMYGSDVLSPWIGRADSGITGPTTPTGFVYQTTRWQINNIWCPGSEAFPDTLI